MNKVNYSNNRRRWLENDLSRYIWRGEGSNVVIYFLSPFYTAADSNLLLFSTQSFLSNLVYSSWRQGELRNVASPSISKYNTFTARNDNFFPGPTSPDKILIVLLRYLRLLYYYKLSEFMRISHLYKSSTFQNIVQETQPRKKNPSNSRSITHLLTSLSQQTKLWG